jgi:hypothetical protein
MSVRASGTFERQEAKFRGWAEFPAEADFRLFPTLVRFNTVYYLHFRCNGRRIVDQPHLWAYARQARPLDLDWDAPHRREAL